MSNLLGIPKISLRNGHGQFDFYERTHPEKGTYLQLLLEKRNSEGQSPSCDLHDLESPGLWVSNFVVPFDMRRQGHGYGLMNAVLEYAEFQKKATAVALSCQVNNEAALALYRQFNFKPVCFGKDSERFIMVKMLR